MHRELHAIATEHTVRVDRDEVLAIEAAFLVGVRRRMYPVVVVNSLARSRSYLRYQLELLVGSPLIFNPDPFPIPTPTPALV